MASLHNVQRLSGSAATGAATVLTLKATSLTEVHSVPAGETHEISVSVTNRNAAAVVIEGNVGATSDAFSAGVPATDSKEIISCVLVGPATIDLAAVANPTDAHFYGWARVHKYTS